MDLDNVLKVEENQFPVETDFEFHTKVLPFFKIQEDSYQQPEPEPPSLLPQIMKHLHQFHHVVDIPMQDLLSEVKEMYINYDFNNQELSKALKKMKIMLKRERAKKRRESGKLLQEGKSKGMKINESQLQLSEEELKRKKNRISAQISRDRKKEYFNELVKENQSLKSYNHELQRENLQLRRLFDQRIYESISGVIQQLDSSTLRELLQTKKDSPSKKGRKSKKMRDVGEKVRKIIMGKKMMEETENRQLNI